MPGKFLPAIVEFFEIVFIYLDTPLRWLFGRDIFISYSRYDAKIYAQKLNNRLTGTYSCYLDQKALPRGEKLPRAIRRNLRRCSMLVLVGTKGAIDSQFVKIEISKFLRTGRTIVPLNVNGQLSAAPWREAPWTSLEKVFQSDESKEAIEANTPSDSVVDYIKDTADFTRQDQRLRRIVNVTAAFVVLSLLAAALSYRSAQLADGRAINSNKQANAANVRAGDAERRAENANINANAADARAVNANSRAANANERATVADAKAANANIRAEQAARREEAATRNARKQESIAFSRSLAAQSDLYYNPSADLLEHNLLYSIESMKRDYSVGAYRNLLAGIDVLPVASGPPISHPDYVFAVAYSPDGRLVATRTEHTLFIWKADEFQQASRREPFSQEHTDRIFDMKFSPGGRYLATLSGGTSAGGTIRTWDLNTNTELPRINLGRNIGDFVFSNDEQYLAVGFASTQAEREQDDRKGNFARVWRIGSRMEVVGCMPHAFPVRTLAFSSDGTQLATYGYDIWIWQTLGCSQDEPKSDRQLSVGELKQLAYSPDGKFLIAAGDIHSDNPEVRVWDTTSYQRVTGFPLKRANQLRFSEDGRYIAALVGDDAPSRNIVIIERDREQFRTLATISYITNGPESCNLMFSRDGRYLAAGGPNQMPQIYESASGRLVTYVGLSKNVLPDEMAISPDGKHLVVGVGRDIFDWGASNAGLPSRVVEQEGGSHTVAVSSDGGLLAASGLDYIRVNKTNGEFVSEKKTSARSAFALH
jgi:WD40 repeat protein